MADFSMIESLARSMVEQVKQDHPYDLEAQHEALRVYCDMFADELYNKAEDILLVRPTS